MHILGVASTFGGVILPSGGPGVGYTDWDRYLYKKNGVNDYTKLIIPGNDPDCCGKQQKNPLAPAAFPGTCDVDIMFRDDVQMLDIAEVSRNGQNNADVSGINNRLSHLDIACGSEQYVMHPGIPPSPDLHSYPRRLLTQAELDILCRIGYPAAGSCDNCVVVAEDDVIDELIFLTGLSINNPITKAIFPPFPNALLGNDVYSSGNVTFELCGHDIGIEVEYLSSSNNVQITGITPGTWEFCYRLSSCNGFCDEATVLITVLDHAIPTGCVTDDCNLVCFGDFETFPVGISIYYPALDIPTFTIDNPNALGNTPDIFNNLNSGSKVVHFGAGTINNDWEPVRVPLSQPIQPGCDISIDFEFAGYNGDPIFWLDIYGLTAPPCSEVNEPIYPGDGQPFDLCTGVEAIAIQHYDQSSLLFDEDAFLDGMESLHNLELKGHSYTFTYPPNASQPLTELLFYCRSNVIGIVGTACVMDNLSVTSSCNTQIQITPHIVSQCIGGQAVIEYRVCLLGSGTNPITIDLQAEIPFGFSVVAGGPFNSSGLASFSLVPGTECAGGSNTTVVTLTMDVSPNFDPLQAPIHINIPMHLVGSGLCIDPAAGDGGDVELMLEDCSLPAAECFCPPNMGYYTIGEKMGSENDLSTSGLPLVLDNTCIAISGRFNVDRNFKVTNSHIIMNRGAEIVVRKKGNLEIFDNLIEGCNHQWRGITVFSGLHAERNTIRDAQWAVRTENKSGIWVMDNNFERNYVAFYVPDVTTGLNTVNTLRLQLNEVTCTTPLKPAYTVPGNADHQQVPEPGARTFAGAYLNDVAGFNISFDNVFDGIRNGVVANNSTFTMNQCTVKNLINYLYPIGQSPGGAFNYGLYGVRATDCASASVTNCNMSGVHQGVRAERSNITVSDENVINADLELNFSDPDESFAAAIKADFGTNRSAIITDNTLTSCGDGISLFQWQPAANLLVSGNEISLTSCTAPFGFNGIAMVTCERGEISDNTIKPSTASTATGLSIGNCRNIFVHNNTFYDLATGESGSNNINCYFLGNTAKSDMGNGSPAGTAGLGFTNAFSDNPYCCNIVDGLSGNGFEFDGPSTGTSFTYSQIKDAAMGMRLTESADISPQNHAKNRWFAGNAGAFHASDDVQFIFQSLFTCEPALIPPFATAADQPGMPGVPWFVAQGLPPGPIQPLCLCPYPQVPDLPRVTPQGDYPAAIGGYQLGQYTGAYNWMTQQRLYERLRQAPQLASTSPNIAAFYQSADNNVIGAYDAVKQAIRDLIGRNEYSRYVIGGSIERLNSLSEELRLLQQDPYSAELDQDIKAHQLYQEVGRYKSYVKAVEQQQANEIGALLTANTDLSASTVPQANERILNRVILENHLWEGNSLIAGDLMALSLIAAQCPLSGGFSVYQARGILTALGEGQNWDDAIACTPIGGGRGNERGQVGGVTILAVYPNPANDIVTFENLSYENEYTEIDIFSSQGDKIETLQIPSGQISTDWNTRGTKNGLYWYRVRLAGRSTLSGKVVIIH